MSSSNSSSNGMGLCGWLTLLFVGLKLTGYITWPWIWVLAPVWIPLLILLGFFALVLLGALILDR